MYLVENIVTPLCQFMAQNSDYKWSQIFVEINSAFEKLSQNDSSVTYSEMHNAKNCKMIIIKL